MCHTYMHTVYSTLQQVSLVTFCRLAAEPSDDVDPLAHAAFAAPLAPVVVLEECGVRESSSTVEEDLFLRTDEVSGGTRERF